MNKNIRLPLPAVLPAREATLDDVPQQAVQMAMTVIDAMRLYAARCDRWVGSFGVRGRHSMLHDFFPRLAMLLPEFAGDCYDPASPSRKATAAILEKELSNIELYDDYGKI